VIEADNYVTATVEVEVDEEGAEIEIELMPEMG
jgi:hypothetical protein